MANQTVLNEGWTGCQYSTKLAVVFGLSLVLMSGCAYSRRPWYYGPYYEPWYYGPWRKVATDKTTEPAVSDTKNASLAEPVVAANVALKTSTEDESKAPRLPKYDKWPKLPFSRHEAKGSHPDTPPTDQVVRSDGVKSEGGPPSATVQRVDSSMERLHAALSDDLREREVLPQKSLTALADRMRVDALMGQAKEFLEIGQLEQARRIAQMAHELGETAQIDYAADEDRPIDLVRRIEGQLEAIRLKDESQSVRDVAEAPISNEKPGTGPKSAASTTAPQKDSSSLARLRRDWSTLFRRDKKPAVEEAATGAEPSQPSSFGVLAEPVPEGEQAKRKVNPPGWDTIVVANRIVSLGAGDSEMDSSASDSHEQVVTTSIEPESPTESRSSANVVMEASELRNLRRHSTQEPADMSKPILDSDEKIEMPTDFDAELATPVAERTIVRDQRPRIPVYQDSSVEHDSDWTGIYIGFGLFCLLVIGCYRRDVKI